MDPRSGVLEHACLPMWMVGTCADPTPHPLRVWHLEAKAPSLHTCIHTYIHTRTAAVRQQPCPSRSTRLSWQARRCARHWAKPHGRTPHAHQIMHPSPLHATVSDLHLLPCCMYVMARHRGPRTAYSARPSTLSPLLSTTAPAATAPICTGLVTPLNTNDAHLNCGSSTEHPFIPFPCGWILGTVRRGSRGAVFSRRHLYPPTPAPWKAAPSGLRGRPWEGALCSTRGA